MRLKFWGTRGSISVTGKNYCRYGGNTPCIELQSETSDDVIILDAGSGIRELGLKLTQQNKTKNIYLFFSHFHTDHIVGLPFFVPLYRDEYTVQIFGKPYVYNSIEQIIDLIINPPLFSITRSYLKSKLSFHDIEDNFVLELNDLIIETIKLNHPHPTLGYKLTHKNKSIVYFTDNELIQNNHSIEDVENYLMKNHSDLISFCEGCEVLIHDTSYSIKDYNLRIGWGHSSNLSGAIFAHLAKVKKFYLFHYDPTYDDDSIDKLLSETCEVLSSINSKVECFAASDYMELNL